MKNLKLADLAAIAEIITAVAVVVSLAFVVVSLRQTTAVIQATNDNFIYELTDTWESDLATNPDLNIAWIKFRKEETLTEAEEWLVYWQVSRWFNATEMAFNRFREGLMPKSQWHMWSDGFVDVVSEDYWVTDFRQDFGEEFVDYVDAIYQSK